MKEIDNWYCQAIKQGMLLGRFFLGKATREENQEVEEWKRSTEAQEEIFGQLSSECEITRNILQYEKLLCQQDWQGLKQLRVARKRSVWMRYGIPAAAVAAFVVIGVTAFLLQQEKPAVVQSFEPVAHGGYRATLYSNDKQIMNIRENMQVALKADSSVVIAKNQLVHTTQTPDEAGVELYTLVTPRGGEFVLVLQDGTKVWMNADSRLTYPSVFRGNCRTVELDGEAYFDVAKNDQMPFIVKSSKMEVEVYGTAFNVMAYSHDRVQKITLERGSIGVHVAGNLHLLAPDQQIILEDNQVEITTVNAKKSGMWREGVFAFDNEELEVILNDLARWYDVKIHYTDSKIKALHFSGELNRYGDISQLLKMIELTTDIGFCIEERQITVYRQ